MIFEHNNYRSFLKATLVDRVAKNPRYSLRSFAANLGISHAALSQVLKGTKNLSFERAMDIGQRLRLSDSEQELFCLLVQSESVKDAEKRSAILDQINRLKPLQKTFDLNLDVFRVISDWYHFPILCLTRVRGFDFTPTGISDALGITEVEAAVAVERLQRLELLEQDDSGWRETQGHILSSSETPSGALKKFHRQMLEKALASIDEQDPKSKVNGSETLAFNPVALGEARKLTDTYFDDMIRLSEKTQADVGATDVYHLQVNFFNLMKPKHGVNV